MSKYFVLGLLLRGLFFHPQHRVVANGPSVVNEYCYKLDGQTSTLDNLLNYFGFVPKPYRITLKYPTVSLFSR